MPGCDKPHDARGYCSGHYQKWRVYGDPAISKRNRGTCSVDGCDRPHAARTWCSVHYYRWKRTGEVGDAAIATPDRNSRRYINNGYVMVKIDRPHPRADSRGWVREHLLVMEQKIGRPVRRGEEVHHVNGQKQDNRPENLELWVVKQPKGQRPEDLVAWAHEILALYEQAS